MDKEQRFRIVLNNGVAVDLPITIPPDTLSSVLRAANELPCEGAELSREAEMPKKIVGDFPHAHPRTHRHAPHAHALTGDDPACEGKRKAARGDEGPEAPSRVRQREATRSDEMLRDAAWTIDGGASLRYDPVPASSPYRHGNDTDGLFGGWDDDNGDDGDDGARDHRNNRDGRDDGDDGDGIDNDGDDDHDDCGSNSSHSEDEIALIASTPSSLSVKEYAREYEQAKARAAELAEGAEGDAIPLLLDEIMMGYDRHGILVYWAQAVHHRPLTRGCVHMVQINPDFVGFTEGADQFPSFYESDTADPPISIGAVFDEDETVVEERRAFQVVHRLCALRVAFPVDESTAPRTTGKITETTFVDVEVTAEAQARALGEITVRRSLPQQVRDTVSSWGENAVGVAGFPRVSFAGGVGFPARMVFADPWVAGIAMAFSLLDAHRGKGGGGVLDKVLRYLIPDAGKRPKGGASSSRRGKYVAARQKLMARPQTVMDRVSPGIWAKVCDGSILPIVEAVFNFAKETLFASPLWLVALGVVLKPAPRHLVKVKGEAMAAFRQNSAKAVQKFVERTPLAVSPLDIIVMPGGDLWCVHTAYRGYVKDIRKAPAYITEQIVFFGDELAPPSL